MLLEKLKVATVLLLTTATLGGVAGLAYQTQAKEKTPKAATTTAESAKSGAAKNILQNAGFEEGDKTPEHWSQGAEIDGVQYIWDKEHGKQGKASICLHKTAKRYFPIAQWYQVVDRKGDEPALRVTAQVKAEGVTKAVIDVIFLDEKGEWIEHHWAAYIGAKDPKDPPVNHDWKEYSGRVEIPQSAKKIQVALQIYGPGKVWFDEVRAEYTNGQAEKSRPKEESKDKEELDFLERMTQLERDAVPFPDEAQPESEGDLGFFPPAKALLGKGQPRDAVREAHQKAFVKLLVIAEIQESLKKLAASTDDKTDQEALARMERAIRIMKGEQSALHLVYPVKDLKIDEIEKKK